MSARKKKVLTLLLSVFAALLIGEAAIRLFAPIKYHRLRYYRACDIFQCIPGTTSHHPTLGHFNNSNLDVPFKTREFTTRVRTNSHGLRDDEKSFDNPEVLFLGDSYAFGWGVEDDETCDKFFERQTGLSSLNMGVSGYGSVQQYELLRIYCEEKDYRDGMVVFLVFQNDLRDNVKIAGPMIPRIRKVGTQSLITQAGTQEQFDETLSAIKRGWHASLSRYSCVGDVLVATLLRPRIYLGPETYSGFEPIEYPGYWVNRGESFELIFRRIRAYCESRSLRLFVAYIPACSEIEKGERHPHTVAVNQVLTALGVAWIDLTQVLTAEDYYYLDGHLKAHGQRKMAESIARSMIELGWIPKTKKANGVRGAMAEASR